MGNGPHLEIRLLGPLEVGGDGGAVSLPRGRARALLAVLALRPGRVVSTDVLIDLLWGASPPATARTKLHGLVSALRKALAPSEPDGSVIATAAPGYRLAVDPDQVDAIEFRREVGRSKTQPPLERIATLRDALDLWRGPVLADFRYEPFAQDDIVAYEELRIAAIEARITAELEIGHDAYLLPELTALIAEHPYRERLRTSAMLAHYRSGNQQMALQVAHDARATLAHDLGVEPGPELIALEKAILDHDTSLQPKEQRGIDTGSSTAHRLLSETRKTVTVMFVDVGLPAGDNADPEAQRSATRRRQEAVERTIRSYGGSVQGSIGGVTVAVFGLPTAHEDDPLRAVRAAADLTAADAAEQLGSLRIGISTGEIVAGGPPVGPSLTGATPRAAAQLQSAAARGEVLLGDETRLRVGGAAEIEPGPDTLSDDGGKQLVAWRLLAIGTAASSVIRRDAPWVGRNEELARLRTAAGDVVASARPIRMTVIGEAGIGKSRLAAQFTSTLPDSYRVLTGECRPYGDGITFWPLREIVRAAAGGTDVAHIAEVLDGVDHAATVALQLAGTVGGTDYPGRPDVLFPAVRRFFEALARSGPLVVILDDMHWAQPTFVDLVDYLADEAGAPMLLLCLARPEFSEHHPSWVESSPSMSLMLDPLDRLETARLIELGMLEHGVASARAAHIVELAGGNPLFVNQMLAALGDDDELTIPRSLHALLVARLDRLGPAEREIVRAASVWGTNFSAAQLSALLATAVTVNLHVHLEALQRRRLLTRSEQDDDYRFRHGLIQQTAYQTVTKDDRARLHELVAEAIAASADGALAEVDEMIGFHLEQAFAYRSELGGDSDDREGLARRAGEHLSRAGTRAFARLDAVASESLLSRSLRLLPEGHRDRLATARYLVESHQVMGRHDAAGRLLDELLRDLAESDDEVLEQFLRVERVWTRLATGPDPMSLAEIEAEADRAQQVFENASYDLGLAQIGRIEWHLHLRRGEMPEMEQAAYRELERAGRTESGRERLAAEWGVAIALEQGPRSVDDCIERCLRIDGEIENMGVASTLAYFHAMKGDFDEAHRLTDRALRILRERVRAHRPLGRVKRRAADVALLAGDIEAGIRLLSESLDLHRRQGERDQVAQDAGDLARVLVRHGRVGDAEALAVVSRTQAPAESVASQATWRASLGLVRAARGDRAEAERLLREAAALVPEDMTTLRAYALLDLSDGLDAGGHDEAHRIREAAIALFEQKGNHRGVAAARRSQGLP